MKPPYLFPGQSHLRGQDQGLHRAAAPEAGGEQADTLPALGKRGHLAATNGHGTAGITRILFLSRNSNCVFESTLSLNE